MPICKTCGLHEEDANYLTPDRDLCINCGPHVAVTYYKNDGHPYVTVRIMNVDGYSGGDDAIFYHYGTIHYKKVAKQVAKELARKQGRNLPIIYDGLQP